MIPALEIVLDQVNCNFISADNPNLYMVIQPSIRCFYGVHIFTTVMAAIMAIGLYTTAIFYIYYLRKHVKDFIRYSAPFEIALIMGKTLFTSFSVFLGSNSSGGKISLSVLLIVTFTFFISNYIIQPCRGRAAVANDFRTASYAGWYIHTKQKQTKTSD